MIFAGPVTYLQLHITEHSLRHKAIDKALVKMLAIDMQPGSTVENKGFQDFLKVIDPKYIPPSHRTIMRDHLPILYQGAMEELQVKLSTAQLPLTWTSQATMGM